MLLQLLLFTAQKASHKHKQRERERQRERISILQNAVHTYA
jgi:hypothetical protein